MKVVHIVNVTRLVCREQVLRAAFIGLVLSGLSACNNYTAAPLCSEANAVDPSVLYGTYIISDQDPDTFVVTTDEIEITPEERKGAVKLSGVNVSESAGFCQVGDKFILENKNDDVAGFEQYRVFINEQSLVVHPLIYDRLSLENAGIGSLIFKMPEDSRKAHYRARRGINFEDQLGLMIKNFEVTPEALLENATIPVMGFTLLRK